MTTKDRILLCLLAALSAAVVCATVGWRTGLAIIGLTAALLLVLAGWWWAMKHIAAACDRDMGEPQHGSDRRVK